MHRISLRPLKRSTRPFGIVSAIRTIFTTYCMRSSDGNPQPALTTTPTVLQTRLTDASMTEPSAPYPLFPPLAQLKEHPQAEHPINFEVRRRLYPGRQFALGFQFNPFFLRYSQLRRLYSRSVSHKSFLIPLGHGADAYGYGSLIENLSEFTASILEELRARPAAAREHWRGRTSWIHAPRSPSLSCESRPSVPA